MKISKISLINRSGAAKQIGTKFIYFTIFSLVLLISLSSCHTSNKAGVKKSGKTRNERVISHIHMDEKNKRGKKVVKEAMEWEGTPYKYAGSEKGVGTDCSGMVMATYLETTGIKLPRNSAKQAEFCEKISSDELKVGDLCYFATGKDPEKISHVGIMIDEENFIHASTSKGVVISKITTPYYIRTFIQFGRVPD